MAPFSPCSSFCPNRIENKAPLPMHSPNRMEVRKVISVKADPTAARAFAPRFSIPLFSKNLRNRPFPLRLAENLKMRSERSQKC